MTEYITCNGCGVMVDSEFVSAPNINTYLCPSRIAMSVYFDVQAESAIVADSDKSDTKNKQRETNET